MKKKLALLLAAVMSLQPLAAISIIAEGESTVEKVYADVYGIEIDFTTAGDAEAAESSISLAEKEGGAAVAVTATVSTDVETKVVVTPDNSELLDVDTPYTLTIGDETKDFQIKTMFYEDFENLTYDTYTGALPGEDIVDTKSFSNKYGNYSLTAGDGGAFVRKVNGDTEVGVTNGAFAITDIDTFENLSDATFMADIKGYRKNRLANAVATEGQVNISVLSRSQTTGSTEYTKASKLLLTYNSFEVGTTNASAEYTTAVGNTGYVIPNDSDGNYGFGKLVNAGSLVVSKDTAVDGTNESTERAIALRTNGTTITGFADAEAVTHTDASVETTAGDFVIGLTNLNRGLAVIDNVRVTMYTEDLSPIPSGTITAPTLNGDTTKLTLDFNEELTGIGPVSLDTIIVKENETEVEKVITVDETDKSILNIVLTEGITADNNYTVIIPNGFGVGDLRVEEAAGFTLQKDIAPTPMAITNKQLTPTSINITFDRNIEEITTTESGYITVYKKAIGADDSTYTEIPYANITFTKEDDVLKIAPNAFAVDNTYKVVIAQGYGDTNYKVTAQTEYVVDFVQIEATPTEVTGNLGVVVVEFDQTIDTATPTTGVEILNTQTGEVMSTTATITTDGKLNVAFPTMEKGTEYEIFIPEGFGTEAVGTKKDFRKKFAQEIVASEDFEGTTVGDTIPGAITAKTQADRWDTSETPNHRGYKAGGTFVFSTNTTYNEDGTVKELGTSDMENLTIEFKHQALYPIRDNTGSGSTKKKYNEPFLYDQFHFNKTNTSNYNWLYFMAGNLQLRDRNSGSDTNYSNTALDHERSGDAYRMSNGTLFVYNAGEAFSSAEESYPFAGKVLTTTGAEQTVSTTTPKDGNTIRIVKTGNTITVYVKNISTGVFEQRIGPVTMASTQKKGSIEYVSAETGYYSLDDIEITAFKVYEETGIVAAAMSVTPTGGDWATATAAEGSITLVNYTAEDMNMAVVAVAYGENGEMLSAYYNNTVPGLDAAQRSNVTFSLNNLGRKTKSVKVFVWDNTTNRAPMSVYELIDTE